MEDSLPAEIISHKNNALKQTKSTLPLDGHHRSWFQLENVGPKSFTFFVFVF